MGRYTAVAARDAEYIAKQTCRLRRGAAALGAGRLGSVIISQ
jgi:hypothetical protein